MANAGARAYNGGLAQRRAPGGRLGGRSPPEAKSPSAFRRPVEVAELPHSAYFAKPINQAIHQ